MNERSSVQEVLLAISSRIERRILIWISMNTTLIAPWSRPITEIDRAYLAVVSSPGVSDALEQLDKAPEDDKELAEKQLEKALIDAGSSLAAWQRLKHDLRTLYPWSAERFLGRPPTRTETMSLSRALRGLEESGFIERVSRGRARYTSHVRLLEPGQRWAWIWWMATNLQTMRAATLPQSEFVTEALQILEDPYRFPTIGRD